MKKTFSTLFCSMLLTFALAAQETAGLISMIPADTKFALGLDTAKLCKHPLIHKFFAEGALVKELEKDIAENSAEAVKSIQYLLILSSDPLSRSVNLLMQAKDTEADVEPPPAFDRLDRRERYVEVDERGFYAEASVGHRCLGALERQYGNENQDEGDDQDDPEQPHRYRRGDDQGDIQQDEERGRGHRGPELRAVVHATGIGLGDIPISAASVEQGPRPKNQQAVPSTPAPDGRASPCGSVRT